MNYPQEEIYNYLYNFFNLEGGGVRQVFFLLNAAIIVILTHKIHVNGLKFLLKHFEISTCKKLIVKILNNNEDFKISL